jgi:chondroitin-sulfate-ABC endolyase/exolyase
VETICEYIAAPSAWIRSRLSVIAGFLALAFTSMATANHAGDTVSQINPGLLSFEQSLPPGLTPGTGSTVSLSQHRYLIGSRSLQWDWQPGNTLQFDQIIEVRNGSVGSQPGTEGDFPARPTFVFRIYSERPVATPLTVEFGGPDGVYCRFSFGLNFTGWRTAWVRFSDMEGHAQEQMSFFRFVAPSGVPPGRLYLDAISPSVLIDERLPANDYQTRARSDVSNQLQPRADMAELDWSSPLPGGLYPKATPKEAKAVAALGARIFKAGLRRQDVTDSALQTLHERYNAFEIAQHGDHVTGRFVANCFVQPKSLPPEHLALISEWKKTDIRTAGILLRDLAFAYHSTADTDHTADLGQMFLNLSVHLLDQGWAEGHIHGSNFLFGYAAREYYLANFLMRDLLAQSDLLTPVSRAMEWYQPARPAPPRDQGINMDYLRTGVQGALATVLMAENVDEQVYWTRSLAQNLSASIANIVNTHDSGIKPDGTTFHHWGHYPAYAVGGLAAGTQLVKWLSQTPFRLSPEAYRAYASALLAQRIYTNGSDIPNGISGRHPFRTRFNLLGAYLNMALSGTPDGTREVDATLASAYLRLAGPEADPVTAARFAEEGIAAEGTPEGHWTFPYANLNIHRRDNWMLSVKGYGKYVWASEIYAHVNRFGRNQSNGAIEIYNAEGQAASGYRVEGWNWNRIPGTTALHLPLDELPPPIDITMSYSPETFVGGAHLAQRDGVFGMTLNETRFGHALYARKTAFCFGNRVVCLGSDIRSSNETYPAETTLYQSSLPHRRRPIHLGAASGPVADFPYKTQVETPEEGFVLSGPYGNAYYLPGNQQLHLSRTEQISEHSHEVRETRGDFATAWLSHGVMPVDGRYEYAILIQTTPAEAEAFATRMRDAKTAEYEILSHSSQSHIVRDRRSGTTGYALFEAGPVDGDVLISASAPCFVMTRVTGDFLEMSLADPDLHMQATASPARLPGEYRLDDPSAQPQSLIRITLAGRYELAAESTTCRVVRATDDQTELEFTCRHGASIQVTLSRGDMPPSPALQADRELQNGRDRVPVEFVTPRPAPTRPEK